jgi:hypothetical protein
MKKITLLFCILNSIYTVSTAQVKYANYYDIPNYNQNSILGKQYGDKLYCVTNVENYDSLATGFLIEGPIVYGNEIYCIDEMGNTVWKTYIQTNPNQSYLSQAIEPMKTIVKYNNAIYAPYSKFNFMDCCNPPLCTTALNGASVVHLAKLDATTGVILKNQEVSPMGYCRQYSEPAIKVKNDTILLAFYHEMFDSIYLLKLDTNLNFISIKTKKIAGKVQNVYFTNTDDLYCTYYNYTVISSDYGMLKFDYNFNLKWNKLNLLANNLEFNIDKFGNLMFFRKTYDMVGTAAVNATDFVRIDTSGNILNFKHLPNSNYFEVKYTKEDKIIAIYYTFPPDTMAAYYQLLDSNFNVIQSIKFDSTETSLNSIVACSDTSIILIGDRERRYNFGNCKNDMLYVCNLDFGKTIDTTTIIDTTGISDFYSNYFTLAPNPTSTQFTLTSNTEISEVQVLDISGKVLLTTQATSIDVSHFAAGVYLVQVRDTQGRRGVKKLVVD